MGKVGHAKLGQTPSQTVGPFFHYALPYENGGVVAATETAGAHIEISGRVVDGDGAPVPDAMVEIWQANAAGRYNHPDDIRADLPLDAEFLGFGRTPTDAEGFFRFATIRPGRVPGPGNSLQAPHIAVGIFARGLLKRLVTRIYFEDEAGNDDDPVLASIDPARRPTLIAKRENGAGSAYRFDIVLQGDAETVFFDC